MPELPDLEVFKTNIYDRLTSKKLVGVNVFNPSKVNAAQQDLEAALADKTLTTIDRVGKELYFRFTGAKVVATHLMLNGEISILKPADSFDSVKFKIFSMSFEGETIVFSDRGGMLTVKYQPRPGKAPDAFDDAFTEAYFMDMVKKKGRTNIKAFLIDQNIIRGIGNAYADEILWEARVSPHSTTGSIPEEAQRRLYTSIGKVLREAIVSIRELQPDIISGEVRSFLKVHNSRRKMTETGANIKVEYIVSKRTYYTDEQVMYL